MLVASVHGSDICDPYSDSSSYTIYKSCVLDHEFGSRVRPTRMYLTPSIYGFVSPPISDAFK